MVHRTANRAAAADYAIEIIDPASEESNNVNKIFLKETEKKKYLPAEIVNTIKKEGFDKFTMDSHTKLWKALDARDPKKGYGAIAVGKQWCWYDTWLNRVREECMQHPQKYKTPSPLEV